MAIAVALNTRLDLNTAPVVDMVNVACLLAVSKEGRRREAAAWVSYANWRIRALARVSKS